MFCLMFKKKKVSLDKEQTKNILFLSSVSQGKLSGQICEFSAVFNFVFPE